MDFKKQIQQHIAFNEQEEKDKEMMLQYIDLFENILTRECEIAHFSSSAFLVNKTRDKVLMIYHNIYQSWAWTGGHCDGENNFLSVAIREAQEETGIQTITPIGEEIFSLEILPVWGHVKKGKFIASHQHLNVTYLLEGEETETLHEKEDENSGVQWIPINKIKEYSTETNMYPTYDKIVEKMKTERFNLTSSVFFFFFLHKLFNNDST